MRCQPADIKALSLIYKLSRVKYRVIVFGNRVVLKEYKLVRYEAGAILIKIKMPN